MSKLYASVGYLLDIFTSRQGQPIPLALPKISDTKWVTSPVTFGEVYEKIKPRLALYLDWLKANKHVIRESYEQEIDHLFKPELADPVGFLADRYLVYFAHKISVGTAMPLPRSDEDAIRNIVAGKLDECDYVVCSISENGRYSSVAGATPNARILYVTPSSMSIEPDSILPYHFYLANWSELESLEEKGRKKIGLMHPEKTPK